MVGTRGRPGLCQSVMDGARDGGHKMARARACEVWLGVRGSLHSQSTHLSALRSMSVLCYVMSCYVMHVCHVILCHVMLCHVMPCHVDTPFCTEGALHSRKPGLASRAWMRRTQ
jgi:hypothetical protein